MKTYTVIQVGTVGLMWGVREDTDVDSREVCRFYNLHDAHLYAGVRTWAASHDE